MNRLFAYLPCFNEENNIIDLAFAWEAQAEALERNGFSLAVIAIDDKSEDSTLSIIRELEQNLNRFYVIAHDVNKGLGGALNTAVSSFLSEAEPGDYMAFMDGDNTHRPVYACDMLNRCASGTECAIASRYQKGSLVVGVPRLRQLLSSAARLYYRLFLHIPNVRDYTCGFRVYSYDCLAKAKNIYADKLITQRSFSCMMELLYKLYRSGCDFTELPFTLRYDNKRGTSKMKIFRTAGNSVLLALKLRFNTEATKNGYGRCRSVFSSVRPVSARANG